MIGDEKMKVTTQVLTTYELSLLELQQTPALIRT